MALRFYCRCLNIRIHVDEGSVHESTENNVDEAASSDAFFANVVLVMAPRGADIQKKLQCLTHERLKEHWRINVCLNCGMETHAFSAKEALRPAKVFVAAAMQQNAVTANLISTSKNFSPIYEVLIPQQPKEHSCLPLLSRNQLHNQMEELKAHSIRRLNAENEFLLERIRKFENEQMSLFTDMQIQAQRDQNALNQMLINHYSENEGEKITPRPVAVEHPDAKTRDPKRPKEVQSAVVADSEKTSSPAPRSRMLPVDGSIFMMDDEEPEEAEFGDSNSQDEGETEERVSDDEAFTAQSESFKLFATSLPIAMPGVWQAATRVQEEDNLGAIDRDKMDDPTWIAASIQALAMSVRGNDGTEMFGARPRPRLNTLD